MFSKKSLFLNVSVVFMALLAGTGTIMAVMAADGESTCEGGFQTYYYDADNDGYGDDSITSEACTAPLGYVAVGGDCDDDNASINPGADEICDGLDNECNGVIDNDLATSTYYYDADADAYGIASSTIISCGVISGYAEVYGDCNDSNAEINPGMTEYCDGMDNDCDGSIDNDCINIATSTYYIDEDGDGYGDPTQTLIATTTPFGYVLDDGDCDDSNAARNPGEDEICGDGIDNDCDLIIDENCPAVTTYYADKDNDGYGNPSDSIEATTTPDGYVLNDDDCNDSNSAVRPGVDEVCDLIDNNCNGTIDEGFINKYYADSDDDGYGDVDEYVSSCQAPVDYVVNNTDCNDDNASIHPNATEECDGVDNDCDGVIDEDCGTDNYYQDSDGDGYGNPSVYVKAKTQPVGYVLDETDCNDANVNINPGEEEICGDGIDNDCDGIVDENCGDCDCDCDCDCNCGNGCGEFANHGEQMRYMAQWTNRLRNMGEITGREKGQIMSNAAKNKFQGGNNDEDDDAEVETTKKGNGKSGNSNGNGKGNSKGGGKK